MSDSVEYYLKNYHYMVLERSCLDQQLKAFKELSCNDVITSMSMSHLEGEAVKTRNINDSTANAALSYRNIQRRLNEERYLDLARRYFELNNEILFFESALKSLSGRLSNIMIDMVINKMTWEKLAEKYYVSPRMIGKYRRKAICELESLYNCTATSVSSKDSQEGTE